MQGCVPERGRIYAADRRWGSGAKATRYNVELLYVQDAGAAPGASADAAFSMTAPTAEPHPFTGEQGLRVLRNRSTGSQSLCLVF